MLSADSLTDNLRLHEIEPSLHALAVYLRRQSGGLRIIEAKSYFSEPHGEHVYEMSDGLTYGLDEQNRWHVIPDLAAAS